MSGLRLLAPIAVQALCEELVAQFEEVNGVPGSMSFLLNPEVPERLREGDTPDLVLTSPADMEALIAADLVSRDMHRPFGRLSLALGRSCEMTDPLRTVPELRDFLRDAREIAYTEGGVSGPEFLAALEELGLTEALGDRLHPMGAGEPARAAAAGKVDLAAAPLPVILSTVGLNPVAILPRTLGTDADISMSLTLPGQDRDAAHDLLNHFSNEESDPLLKEHGVARFSFD